MRSLNFPIALLLAAALPVSGCRTGEGGSGRDTPRADEPAPTAAPEVPRAPFDVTTAAADWNPGGIAWRDLSAGLAEAGRTNKPVMMVVHAEWCSHCRNYSRVFHDPALVSLSERFVMVLADSDHVPAANQRYAVDGRYVPRTYFLDAQGEHRGEIDAGRARYRYFYDENAAGPTIASMERALR